jgi:hypothetical protein
MRALLAMREGIAIAMREFLFLPPGYRMEGMKTIAEIRRDNLMILIGEQGSMAALNEKIGLVRTDATLSQIKNQSPDSKTGVPKAMGDAFARRIETQLCLEPGWMDNVHTYSSPKRAAAMAIMENMDDRQLDQAYKILHALAEPHPKAANGD